MTRAEERALEVFPVCKVPFYGIGNYSEIDANFDKRALYQLGYEQAEKNTIERACETLFSMLPIMVSYYNEDIHEHADRGEFIKQFRMKMEEQK